MEERQPPGLKKVHGHDKYRYSPAKFIYGPTRPRLMLGNTEGKHAEHGTALLAAAQHTTCRCTRSFILWTYQIACLLPHDSFHPLYNSLAIFLECS